jgi:hypothetical protein
VNSGRNGEADPVDIPAQFGEEEGSMYKRAFGMAWALALLSAFAIAQSGPRITGVQPTTTSSGATLTVMGENLAERSLEEILLFKEGATHKLEIMKKEGTAVTVKVPKVAPAKYSLALKIQGVTYTEPVEVTVE